MISPDGRLWNGSAASRAASREQKKERRSSDDISSRRPPIPSMILGLRARISKAYAKFWDSQARKLSNVIGKARLASIDVHRCVGAGDDPWDAGDRRVNQSAATTMFATFFLFALGRAFGHIRRRQALHREWMIRAFAVGSPSRPYDPSLESSLRRTAFREWRRMSFSGVRFG